LVELHPHIITHCKKNQKVWCPLRTFQSNYQYQLSQHKPAISDQRCSIQFCHHNELLQSKKLTKQKNYSLRNRRWGGLCIKGLQFRPRHTSSSIPREPIWDLRADAAHQRCRLVGALPPKFKAWQRRSVSCSKDEGIVTPNRSRSVGLTHKKTTRPTSHNVNKKK